MSDSPLRLLIAASGTGGHLFPALAVAGQLQNCHIEWLGVPNRLETQLVPSQYPLHTIAVEGFQGGLSFKSLRVLQGLVSSIGVCRRLLKTGQFQAVFTTGGYIAAPVIIAARSLGLPVILHESNALPGKVTRFLAPWCTNVAVGFEDAKKYLKKANVISMGTPVRADFLNPQPLTLDLPEDSPVIVVMGGSQGAVAVNQRVREAVQDWLDRGVVVVHLTGNNDPQAQDIQHPHYLVLPFYENMGALLHRATLVISRAGAGTLTELAIAKTPALLIPYPYAADDHQTYNAQIFVQAGAAQVFEQKQLTAETLKQTVSQLLQSPETLEKMAEAMGSLAVRDSAEQLAQLIVKMI